MNRNTDLRTLFNEYDSSQVMDMLDNLIIEDSIRDEEHEGRVHKRRLLLDKDYHRNRKPPTISDDLIVDPESVILDGTEYLELGEDGTAPGLDPRLRPMG